MSDTRGGRSSVAATPPSWSAALPDVEPLRLELGEGFSDAEVELLADGQAVWHRQGVTTNYSVGLADVVQLLEAPTNLEVRIRNHEGQHRLTMPVGADVRRLRVWFDPAGEPHGGPSPEGPVF